MSNLLQSSKEVEVSAEYKNEPTGPDLWWWQRHFCFKMAEVRKMTDGKPQQQRYNSYRQ